jgi:hypothetical protein
MYTIIEFNDYRKDVVIKCLGYSSDLAKAESYLFTKVIDEYSKRYLSSSSSSSAYVILYKVMQTDYVSLMNPTRLQYRAAVIKTSAPLTTHRFCDMFLSRKGKSIIGKIESNQSNDLLTQEWLTQNIATISEHFLDKEYEDEEEEEDEDEDSQKIVQEINKYSSIYAITQIEEI